LQVAFTIKELREMLNLPDCVTVCNPQDFETVRSAVPSECHAISKATGHFSRNGFQNKICIVNVPVFFMCDHEIHIRMWQFILLMATTVVHSTFGTVFVFKSI